MLKLDIFTRASCFHLFSTSYSGVFCCCVSGLVMSLSLFGDSFSLLRYDAEHCLVLECQDGILYHGDTAPNKPSFMPEYGAC